MILSREEMIEKHLTLVKQVAGRLPINLPPHLDGEDLISYGVFGLMDAVDKFDPSRGVKFETYASQRIRGAILDAIRQQSWAPRSVIEKLRRVNDAYKAFEGGEREPTEEELASEAEMSVKDFRLALGEVNRLSVDSLEQFLLGDLSGQGRVGDLLEDPGSPNPEEAYLDEEIRESLAKALAALPERDYLVVSLYYGQELTLKEVGGVLGVSESRVSQLHSKALLRLKEELTGFLK
ncbi:MAG: FliA/WhiG family RNA polymerase sigma factor [Bacillota bacterium]